MVPVLVMCVFLHGAAEQDQGELSYRATLTFRGQAPVKTRFVLIPTPIVETQNKVKKPRMGGWRLEAVQRKEDTHAQAALLARLERLLYFAGPAPSLVQKPIFIRYEQKKCQVWQVVPPPGLNIYAYLVETNPGILALSYLSGTFESGDLASVEMQLEGFRLSPGAAPAENGTVLLGTLQKLTKSGAAEGASSDVLVEAVE
jgi:hypothetical protein